MKIIAHRGYSGKYPELTHRAFVEALELPIAGIECDVRLSADGIAMVHHDASINRTSNGSGLVGELSYEELLQWNFGTDEYPQEIMTLAQLLELLKLYPEKELYLETKHPSRFGSTVEETVAQELHKAGMQDDPRITLISFDHGAIRRSACLLPHLQRCFLVDPRDYRGNKPIRMYSRPTMIGPWVKHAQRKPQLVGWEGLPTYVWTVDDPTDMRWCHEQGVEVMATNYPELALSVL